MSAPKLSLSDQNYQLAIFCRGGGCVVVKNVEMDSNG